MFSHFRTIWVALISSTVPMMSRVSVEFVWLVFIHVVDAFTETASFDNYSTISSIKTDYSAISSTATSIWNPSIPTFRERFHQSRPQEPVSPDCTQLLIRELDHLLTEDILRQDLSKVGRIINFKLKQDKINVGVQFAYVTFATHAEALQAVHHINSLNFLPGWSLKRRPRSKLHEGPKKPVNGLMAGPQATINRALILVGAVELPKLSIIKLQGKTFIDADAAIHISWVLGNFSKRSIKSRDISHWKGHNRGYAGRGAKRIS